MKKKMLLLSLSLLLVGCQKPTPTEVEITSIEVNNYEKTLKYFKDFDSSNLSLKVTYSDDSTHTYSKDELLLDFDEFSSTTLGKQNIKVQVKGEDISTNIEVEVIPSDSFDLLMIGNSFSDDTIQWVNEICSDLGINANIANLYIGGCTLDTHYNNLIGNNEAYEFRTYDKETNKWKTKNSTSISDALTSYDWEYVSLQQASGSSGIASTYSTLTSTISEIKNIKDDVKFIWNMTWAYQQNSKHGEFSKYNNDQLTMYQAIVDTVNETVESNSEIELVIPNGTSIQNARTSFVGDNLTRDGFHLSYDFGRYIAGLTLVAKMTGVDISTLNYAPKGVSKAYKDIAIESVINAINNPYEVTTSKYLEAPTYDLSNHVEIDYMPVGCAYYNSSDANNYNKLITSASNSINFVASKRFSKDEIPVGSIIEINEGYQYRPEAWIDDTVQTSRPDNVSIKHVEVDEAWWGDYTYRAFNISSTSGGSLMYKMKDAFDAFSIYVPKDLYKEPVVSVNQNDKTLFESQSLDINNYELYNYDYYNGFYNSSLYDDLYIEYNNQSLSKKFICTEGFNKETLPVGSVLIVDSGYKYRPDAWVGKTTTSPRPANVTTNFVLVDETWWGDYTLKGFIISKTDNSVINNIPHEVASHFRIYIPKK